MGNAYDELPYESIPVEWTAPERMAVTSRLHGGARPSFERYRYLELGCGDATNLLPLARYRPAAAFVGIDGSAALMASARATADAIGATNLELVHAPFAEALPRLDGPFDFIVLHGVFSWVDDATRDALLAVAARALAPDGLFYASYNTLPGWGVRGLLRDYLLAQTSSLHGLAERARAARRASAQLAEMLQRSDHPYSQLMARELAIVRDARESYVAHEYLAPINRAYWQSELHALLAHHGLAFVADADFAYPSARLPEGLGAWVDTEELTSRSRMDTLDLLAFAQFRCALACRASAVRQPWSATALRGMRVTSRMFATPEGLRTRSGHEITFDQPAAWQALVAQPFGPSRPVEAIFADLGAVADDLVLLHRNDALELQLWESSEPVCPRLSAHERASRGEWTTPQHLRVTAENLVLPRPER